MNLYQSNIIDHYKNPQNYGEMSAPDLIRAEYNPVCGDKMILYLQLKGNKVSDIKFTGNGCAISMAAASMLTEKVKGMKAEDILKLGQDDIAEMLGIEVNPGRLKCSLLALIGVQNALQKK